MIGAGGLASTRLSRSHRVSSRAQSRACPCPCSAPAHDEGLFAQTRAGTKALKTVTLEEKALQLEYYIASYGMQLHS